ncbi:MAG TPA: DUF4386 domain-containing protein [Chryseosolibacter sp.]|nr:DUF4386 domain-containing protein [Chryseosolibacter sp.]
MTALDVNPLRRTARFAGFLYLLWTLTAMYGLIYVQSKTIVKGDAAATANNILNNEFIFRTGILNGVVSSVLWVLIALTLYRLFRHVNEWHAKCLIALVIVQVPVVFFTEAMSLTALMLVKGEILHTFPLNEKQDLALFLFRMNDHATIALEMFWGLWLIPFGILVYKSGFIPKILGVFLLLNAMAYVIHFLTHILLPDYADIVFKIATPIWTLGEISIMLWLLIKGIKSNYFPQSTIPGVAAT